MKKYLFIIFFLLGIGISNDYLAQTGGKKREHRNQRRGKSLFKRKKSAGNADRFAHGGTKTGAFSKLFRKPGKKGWPYKTSGSRKSHQRDNKHLFTRYRSNGRKSNEHFLARQNAQRAKNRSRGSKTFHRKKY